MKIFLLLLSVILFTISCGSNDTVSGTVVDVNSGSISGSLLLLNNLYQDTAEVYLFDKAKDSLVAKDTIFKGNYLFDSLSAGSYYLYSGLFNGAVQFNDSIDIYVDSGLSSIHNIAVLPLMYRDFKLIPNDSKVITVDSFELEFGYINFDSQNTNLFTLYFTSLSPSNSFGIIHKIDGSNKFDKMYLDVFKFKTFELSSSSSNFSVKNYPLITKTGKPSDSSFVNFYFKGTTTELADLDTITKVILSGDIIDTIYHKLSIVQDTVDFSYSRTFKAADSIHFSIELYDTLSHTLNFTGDAGLRIVKDAEIDLPVELISEN